MKNFKFQLVLLLTNNKMFLNVDDYEYPRSNKTLRQQHKQRWLDYYKCLRETYVDKQLERTNYPSALIALEGTSITCAISEENNFENYNQIKVLH